MSKAVVSASRYAKETAHQADSILIPMEIDDMIGLGLKACALGLNVLFKNAATLSTELAEAKDNYILGKLEKRIRQANLLILDEMSKEVRDMFAIHPGDTLIFLADVEKGMAIERYRVFSAIADAIFAGRSKELYPNHTLEESIAFANRIREMNKGDKSE